MRSFLHETVQTCRKEGYVKMMSGRRRYLPAIKDPNIHARAHVMFYLKYGSSNSSSYGLTSLFFQD